MASVHGKLLWKQSRNEEGGVAYSSFKQFCAIELKMAKSTVIRFIHIANKFTEADAAKLGTERLTMLIQASKKGNLSDAAQAELKETAANTSTGKLREKLHEMGLRTPKQEPKATADELTIGTLLGKKHKIVLCERKMNAKEEYPPAKEVEGSWGFLDLRNDVRFIFGVTKNAAGRWILHVEAKRIEA
jgi:hypothetical protein